MLDLDPIVRLKTFEMVVLRSREGAINYILDFILSVPLSLSSISIALGGTLSTTLLDTSNPL